MNPSRKRSLIRRSARVLASVGYRCAPGPEPFHLIGISSTDICLLFLSEDWPPRPWVVDELQHFGTPANCKKLCHYWPARAKLPRTQVT